MPFISKNISVSKSNGSFANLSYKNPKTDKNKTLTFKLKECYSHFGVRADKYKNFSVGVQLENERQVTKFKSIEKQATKISPVPKPQRRLLKCLYEKGDYTTLYLKLTEDQMTGVKPGQTCTFSGTITFSAIYLGDKEKGYEPNIVVRVGECELKPVKKRKTKTVEDDDSPISDTDDDAPISDSEDED